MLFNSAQYLLLFLPFTLLVYLLLRNRTSRGLQYLWLCLMSLVFYASWDPAYLALILGSVLVNYQLGKLLARSGSGGWLALGVSFNLGLLGVFKYTGFFLDSLNSLGAWLIPVPEITLPLAISFFTFQQIAYLVDVRRGNCEDYRFSHYALFVLFFPQLIAGPIVHHREMMPQFDRGPDPAQLPVDIAVGLTFIAFGLFKKVVLADSLAPIADSVYAAEPGAVSSADAWLAMFAFSFQIYFDFSGYTDLAIGSARLFGIVLPENFHSPYKAASIIEIWRRWHMTLSRFLSQYLYIPLGGNRRGPLRRYRNLVITMLLGGLWHGAAWTFVVWGGLHGLFLCINHGWRALVKRAGLRGADHPLLQPFYILLTFLAWSAALVVFRADSLDQAGRLFSAMGTLGGATVPVGTLAAGFGEDLLRDVYAVLAAAAAICWALPNTQQLLAGYRPVLPGAGGDLESARLAWRPSPAYAVLAGAALGMSLLGLSSISRFIYFQF